MTRFLRPLAILSGPAAKSAVADGLALMLAGGPLAFAQVEVIERDEVGVIGRHIRPAPELQDALTLHCAPRPHFAGVMLDRPVAMGVINVTPDSFSDGGAFLDADTAVAQATTLIGAGARIVDVGGESTRPGANPVPAEEEIRRVVPVIERVAPNAENGGAVISIDTRNAATMSAALAAGATLINDVSALTHDPGAIQVVASGNAPVILMHMQGNPRTMQDAPAYGDVALDIYAYLEQRIAACLAAGLPRHRLAADPGIGFGKNVDHNLALLDQLSLFHGLGVPLVIGVSRKGFIAQLSAGAPAEGRLGGSLAAGLAAVAQGVQILRVHDVAETEQALRIIAALRTL